MSVVDKFYPVQGTNKFQTVSFPITKAFRISLSTAATTGTYTLFTVPKGSVVLGFAARVVNAVETGGAGTVTLGFTGKAGMLSTAVASAAATAGSIIVPNSTAAGGALPYVAAADDTFDLTVTTAALVSGDIDVFLTYVPVPVEDLDTSNFLSYTPST